MKTQLNQSRIPRGNTLVLTLVITTLVGLTLVAYLSLVKTQTFSTSRSQAWNAAVPVIEAGVEDALTHLNVNGTNNLLACCGWSQSGNLYWTTRVLGEGRYVVVISNWVAGMNNLAQPVIDSRAFMNVPNFAAAQPDWMLAVVSGGDLRQSRLARAVRVHAKPRGLFMKGMVSKGTLSFSGNALVDSFDSEDSAKSTNGKYDPTKRQDHGDVASNGQIINAVVAGGQTKIYGKVSTGPGGTAGFTTGASAGSEAWVDANTTGIEPGCFVDDMNVEFPPVGVPFTGGYFSPASGDYLGTNYGYLLDSRRFRADSISLSSTKTMMVIGNAELYVPGNFTMVGQSQIIIAPGASFKLYIGGTASFSGQGIFNQTGNAINLFVFGLPTCPRVSFTGNSEFIGVIYAPSAELKLGGGGSDILDFKGATITGSVNMIGKYQFHYDESLGRKGPVKGYYVTSWDEMTPQHAATLPPEVERALQYSIDQYPTGQYPTGGQ
jgi:hypothetical protein